ncbi:MAG: Mrp/NBP35 family ATP-binding protein [Desulfobacula sp.]|nr:Mrp/NBP35 family ATP-binding protein [Desulfobacula sp.]
MAEKTSKNNDSISIENYSTYYCPHCGEPFGKGILVNIKIICSYCNKFFVMVGLDQKENS